MAKFRQVQSSFAYGVLSEEAASRTDLDFVKQGCSELTNFVVEPIGGIRKRLGFRTRGAIPYSPSFPGETFGVTSTEIIPIRGTDTLLQVKTFFSTTITLLREADTAPLYVIGGLTSPLTDLVQIGDIIVLLSEKELPKVIYPDEGKYKMVSYLEFITRKATSLDSLKQYYRMVPFEEWNLNTDIKINAELTSGVTRLSMIKNGSFYPYFPIYSYGEMYAANYYSSSWVKGLWRSREQFLAINLTLSQTANGVWQSASSLINPDWVEIKCSSDTSGLFTQGDTYFAKIVNISGTAYKYSIATSLDNLAANVFVGSAATGVQAEFSVSKLSIISVDTIISPPGAAVSTSSWSEQQWTYSKGFPEKVSFVGSRLCFLGNKKDPEAIWMSASNNIFQFNNLRFFVDASATTSEVNLFGQIGDTDAHKTRATSAQFNRTSWAVNADELVIGTDGGIFQMNRSQTGDYLPYKTTSSALSYDSAAVVKATMMESGVVFVDSTLTQLKFLSFRSDKKGVNDISLLAPAFEKIKKIVYQASTKILWILDNGKLKSFTMSQFSGVSGFSNLTLDLSLLPVQTYSGNTYDLLEDIFIDSDNKLNMLIHRRDIRVHYVAVIDSPEEAQYSDFWIKSSSPTNTSVWTFNGPLSLALFGNLTVPCTVDGVTAMGTVNALGTSINTTITGKELVVSIPFTARMTTLSLDPGGVLGSAVGALKRPDEVVLKVKNTQNMKVGGKTLYTSKSTLTSYSGDISEKVAADPSTDSRITVESSGNYPCHILSMTFKGFTQE